MNIDLKLLKKRIKLKMMHMEWYYLYTLKKTQKGMVFKSTYINYKTEDWDDTHTKLKSLDMCLGIFNLSAII